MMEKERIERVFKIGDFCFRLRSPKKLELPENFRKFQVVEGIGEIPEYDYQIYIADTFPEPEGVQLAAKRDLSVWQLPAGERRYMGIKGVEGFYACYTEVSEKMAEIYLDPERMSGFSIDPIFVSLLALERRMAERDSLILHSAFVQHGEHALLFSAPSETGKTTQANLWEKYRGTRTVNGDRSLLHCEDGVWGAGGWPVCGTSETCYNESYPIEAIVMLSQGKTNEIRRLSHAEAFKLLYTQITVNGWNRESMLRTMEQIDRLIEKVPVWQLSCTISEEAVACLEKVL